jgi:2-oxoglutarate/2-oxoacid ferredoxin oxidoreductase subunit beta
MKITRKSIKSRITPTWCPGCGNLGILRALHSALEELELNHEDVLIVYGIGCAGNEADFNRAYGLHSLHGREIPNAVGAKLANHDLKIIVVGGDGDLYGEGISHLLSAARGNHDITVLVHNNWRYSLTTGQASPTTPKNTITKTSPEGLIETPLNPLQVALSVNASFVAQGASSNYKQLTEIIKAGINHQGLALIDVAQLCVTFNKEHDIEWFRNHVAELEDHDPTDWQAAFDLSSSDREKILTGIYYQNTETPAYHEQVEQLQAGTLLSQWQDEVELGEVVKSYR